MKTEKLNVVSELSSGINTIFSTEELKNKNLSAYDINQLVEVGHLQRIKRGFYKVTDESSDYNTMGEVIRCISNGSLCLKSALYYHQLLKEEPTTVEVAIPHKAKKPIIPKDIKVKIYYFTEPRYSLGKTYYYELGALCYDQEKTLCDAIYYRKSIDIDLIKEALNNYLIKQDKDINRLLEYGDKLRIGKILRNYLEVLT